MKVRLWDKWVRHTFYSYLTVISIVTSIVFLFVDLDKTYKLIVGGILLVAIVSLYIAIWAYWNNRQSICLHINTSEVEVKYGDIFLERSELKVIAFNEYFDTVVDDKIIAKNTLNGQYIIRYFNNKIDELDHEISEDTHLTESIVEENKVRLNGKKIKYKLGTICIVGDYLLTALTHFDVDNKAYIDMHEYISFLLAFWDEVDRVYAGKTIAIPVFGSGITRFKKYDMVSDQELLELIIWSFKVSRIKFTYPSKVKIVVYNGKRDKINLQALKSFQE